VRAAGWAPGVVPDFAGVTLSKDEIRSSAILTEVSGRRKPLVERIAATAERMEMAQEIEIKLKISDPNSLRAGLNRLGARLVGLGTGRVHEWNVIFDTPDGSLARHGQLLRIRTETPERKSKKPSKAPAQRVLLTFKRPVATTSAASGSAKDNHRHKVREEFELQVTDGDILTKIFESLGMKGWFRYEKYRRTFRLPAADRWAQGLLIEVDETPIGTFVELEGPPAAIDRAAQELGFTARDYIVMNYLSLYVEDCRRQGKEPKDMVFAATK
jgi:adenylate cyclase, class 2